jgi:uncharacterized protein YegL
MADLTQRELDRLIRTTQVLASGISDMWGTYLTPSDKWAANVKTGEIEYDLGLAAMLNEQARKGVVYHEIAHLRYSRPWKLPPRFTDPRDMQWAAYMVNLFEDCRIERLMREEFPGTAEPLDSLRDTWKHPDVIRTMAMAEPHMQFANALYCLIFGLGAQATDPRVLGLVQTYASEALDLTHVAKTSQMVKGLCRADGIVDAMIDLRPSAASPAPPPQAPEEVVEEDESVMPTPDGDAGEGEPGGSADGDEFEPTDPNDPAVGADAGDGEPGDQQQGSGGETLAGDDEVKATVPDPDEYDMSGGASGRAGEDDGQMSDEDAADYAEWDDDEEDDPSGSPMPTGDGGGGGGALTPEQMAAMTPEQRELLKQGLASVARGDDVPVPERVKADELGKTLHGSRQMVDRLNGQAKRIMAARNTHEDDLKYGLADFADSARYWKIVEQIGGDADYLKRGLTSTLSENAFDRWSSVAYETGGRIHVPALARGVKTGRRDVFRRQTRNKNRRYAVALVVDCSGSMWGRRLAEAQVAIVQMAQALRRTPGVDFAIYAFAGDFPDSPDYCACLKPFDMDMSRREGIVGGFISKLGTNGSPIGGGTYLGRAIERVGAELLGSYGDDWRKLVITVTDGVPSDDPEPIVRQLWRKHEVDFVGISIGNPGRLARIMPHYLAVQNAYELGGALTTILRRAIRKG